MARGRNFYNFMSLQYSMISRLFVLGLVLLIHFAGKFVSLLNLETPVCLAILGTLKFF